MLTAFQVSTSLVQGHVVGPGRLPSGLAKTLVPVQVQRFYENMTSPDGAGMERNEAILRIGKDMTKAFGYELKVRLALQPFVPCCSAFPAASCESKRTR